MDWSTIASCGSAAAAIVALLISLSQICQSNKQQLFSRRLNLWCATESLAGLYRESSKQLEWADEPQLAASFDFVCLTNTSLLQEISSCISHPMEGDYHLRFHLKLDELKRMASEARFVFKGKPGLAIADFLESYQGLLFSLYRYEVTLGEMKRIGAHRHCSLEEAAASVGENERRVKLFEAKDKLKASFEKLAAREMTGRIKRQMRLANTLKDRFDTFF